MKSAIKVIGRAEEVDFPELGVFAVPARVDTGAKTSSIWASNIKENDGKLTFMLFGPNSSLYTGQKIIAQHYSQRVVASSVGEAEERYAVKMLVSLHGKTVRATFTLAMRTNQVYPMLVGRNILRGKFIVDVKQGKPLITNEKQRSIRLQNQLQHRKELS